MCPHFFRIANCLSSERCQICETWSLLKVVDEGVFKRLGTLVFASQLLEETWVCHGTKWRHKNVQQQNVCPFWVLLAKVSVLKDREKKSLFRNLWGISSCKSTFEYCFFPFPSTFLGKVLRKNLKRDENGQKASEKKSWETEVEYVFS